MTFRPDAERTVDHDPDMKPNQPRQAAEAARTAPALYLAAQGTGARHRRTRELSTRALPGALGALLCVPAVAPGQTRLQLAEVTPGTEWTQPVANGGFQLQGSLVGGLHPRPEGWTRWNDMFADPGTNLVAANQGVVAQAHVQGGASVGMYSRSITLEPATDYVLSAYLWNFGDAANHVTTVVDFNDAPGEPQLTLYYDNAEADRGCFVYRYFTTRETGTNITLRVFYDGLVGAGAAAGYFPVAAQWDNIAITKAAYFALPQTNSMVALQVERPDPAARAATLAWSNAPLELRAQWTSNLAPAAAWNPVTNAPWLSNNVHRVSFTNVTGRRFFRLTDAVDPSTLTRKMLLGYQGWFACPGDGSAVNRWLHWFRSQTPTAANVTVDFWPDIAELEADELFATSMTLPCGASARVYAAATRKTVLRHFRWMRDYGIDGVFLQRFTSELANPAFFAWRNQVASNVWRGAETYGRTFAIMYDISGQPASTLVSTLTNDWNFLAHTMKITSSPRYQRHRGKPVLAIWGFGFTDRPGTPQDALTVIQHFKACGLTVLGGVPTYWRTLSHDSQSDPAWATVYRSFDMISPWAVGRYGDESGADNFRQNLIVPDLALSTSLGLDYMPVIFPGFSWHNLFTNSPLNQIPRNGGHFYWRQAYNAIAANCSMLYGAMFDEMDEGTAMLKLAPTPAELPVEGTFVPLNIDGYDLPSDWYLRLAGAATQMLRGHRPLTAQRPDNP